MLYEKLPEPIDLDLDLQGRMLYWTDRGNPPRDNSPPIQRMLRSGLRVGAGTDATRVASYNPWVSLAWLVTGKTVGGLQLYPASQTLERAQAMRLWTEANTWFSGEEGKKGQIKEVQLADLAVLSDDYFNVPDEEIANITSVLTLLGGKPVHASDEFAHLAPLLPPAMPDWSPVNYYGGYQSPVLEMRAAIARMRTPGNLHRGATLAVPAGRFEGPRLNAQSSWQSRAAVPVVRWMALLGLCAAYLQGGVVKLADLPGAVAEMHHFGLSPALPLAIAVIGLELLASLAILTGYWRWLGALALCIFTAAAFFIDNRYWELGSPQRFAAENAFYEHLGLAGGFLLVAWHDLHDRGHRA